MEKKEFDMKRIVNIENMDFSNPETQKEIFNIIETLCNMVMSLKHENQELKDEINRLKGEKGKPDIKASKKDDINKPKPNAKMEDDKKKNWSKTSKKNKIKIDKEEIVELDTTSLPEDIEFEKFHLNVSL